MDMKKQRWEESESRRKEVRRSEKTNNDKKEDAGARKGKKVAMHCVFSIPCEFRGGTWVLRLGFNSLKLGEHRLRKVGAPSKSQHLLISSLQNHDTNPNKKLGIL